MFNPENIFPEGTEFYCSRNCNSECYFDEPFPDTKKHGDAEDVNRRTGKGADNHA